MENYVMLGEMSGKRRRGRLRTRWLDNVNYIKGPSNNSMRWDARDRDRWRRATGVVKSNQINFIYTPQFSKTIQGCLQCKKSIDVKIKFRKYNYLHH